MATAKSQAVRDLGDTELFDQLARSKEELFNLRFQHVTGQLESYSRLGQVKKEIARLKTELRQREIAAAEALAADEENV